MHAASNVHVAIRLRKLTCNELGLWEMHKLKRKLKKRLALYDQTYKFVERHGLAGFWPHDPVMLLKEDRRYIEGLKYKAYFELAQK